jgi:DNA (cytosine-5)-methyltransferase 1
MVNNQFEVSLDVLSTLLKINISELKNILLEEKIQLDNDIVDIRKVNNIIKTHKKHYNFSIVNLITSEEVHAKINNVKSNGLKVIDLFSGAGGFSCGFRMAGFEIVGSIDVNKAASKTHHLNFPDSITICEDIQEFTPDKMAEQTGNDIDVIIGSPPCQTFSSLSQGKIASLGRDINNDIRNYYYKSFIDYVQYFQPKVFVLENVPGFATKYKGKIYKDLLEFFKNNTDYILEPTYLQSEHFGVPQTRKRLFLAGYKKNYKFSFPESKFGNESENLFNYKLDPLVTVREALSDLPLITDDWRIDEMPYSQSRPQNAFQKQMRNTSSTIRNNICRISNESAKEMFQYLEPGQRYIDINKEIRGNLSFLNTFSSSIISTRCRRLPLDAPSWTVIAHIGMDGYEYIHPTENRTLSVREAARIQSFPDDFVFVGNMREQYIQVGNAVPPLVAKAIAMQVSNAIQSSFSLS